MIVYCWCGININSIFVFLSGAGSLLVMMFFFISSAQTYVTSNLKF